jgi:hypothetical protein
LATDFGNSRSKKYQDLVAGKWFFHEFSVALTSNFAPDENIIQPGIPQDYPGLPSTTPITSHEILSMRIDATFVFQSSQRIALKVFMAIIIRPSSPLHYAFLMSRILPFGSNLQGLC